MIKEYACPASGKPSPCLEGRKSPEAAPRAVTQASPPVRSWCSQREKKGSHSPATCCQIHGGRRRKQQKQPKGWGLSMVGTWIASNLWGECKWWQVTASLQAQRRQGDLFDFLQCSAAKGWEGFFQRLDQRLEK